MYVTEIIFYVMELVLLYWQQCVTFCYSLKGGELLITPLHYTNSTNVVQWYNINISTFLFAKI